MDFNCIFTSSVSACFELVNSDPYYSKEEYMVLLNGKEVESCKKNVFSLYNLTPATKYQVSIRYAGQETSKSFTTDSESACISVKDFGAKGDGVTNDKLALQMAIMCCPTNGRVQVPAGTYYTGPLMLKSDMTLELCEGATILGDIDESHYPTLPGEIADPATGEMVQISSWEGDPYPHSQSFVSAYYAKNIKVVGLGVIDGNANNSTWWDFPKGRPVARPKLVFLNNCENVVFHGVTGQNSAAWNLHPFFSQHIYFYDIVVNAPANSPNTDGSDPESCDDVRYVGIRFSVGDDAIAIKSGKMYMGQKYKTPATNHVIRNCLMEYAHGGVVLGSEMGAGIKSLTVSQCYFSHTDRGLRIKTRRGRGNEAVVDGVEFSNIRMDNVKCPLVTNMFYFCDPDGKSEYVQQKTALPVDDRTPYLGNFLFKDMECTDCEWAAGFFYGLPEMPIERITIDNVSFTFKEDATEGFPAMMCDIEKQRKLGLYFNGVKNVDIKNVTMSGQDGEKIIQK